MAPASARNSTIDRASYSRAVDPGINPVWGHAWDFNRASNHFLGWRSALRGSATKPVEWFGWAGLLAFCNLFPSSSLTHSVAPAKPRFHHVCGELLWYKNSHTVFFYLMSCIHKLQSWINSNVLIPNSFLTRWTGDNIVSDLEFVRYWEMVSKKCKCIWNYMRMFSCISPACIYIFKVDKTSSRFYHNIWQDNQISTGPRL